MKKYISLTQPFPLVNDSQDVFAVSPSPKNDTVVTTEESSTLGSPKKSISTICGEKNFSKSFSLLSKNIL